MDEYRLCLCDNDQGSPILQKCLIPFIVPIDKDHKKKEDCAKEGLFLHLRFPQGHLADALLPHATVSFQGFLFKGSEISASLSTVNFSSVFMSTARTLAVVSKRCAPILRPRSLHSLRTSRFVRPYTLATLPNLRPPQQSGTLLCCGDMHTHTLRLLAKSSPTPFLQPPQLLPGQREA